MVAAGDVGGQSLDLLRAELGHLAQLVADLGESLKEGLHRAYLADQRVEGISQLVADCCVDKRQECLLCLDLAQQKLA